MLSKLYDLITHSPIDYIYDSIFSLQMAEEFSEIDRILENVDINKLTPVHMLSFLTITRPQDGSNARSKFYDKVHERLSLMFNKEKVERMLVGLK